MMQEFKISSSYPLTLLPFSPHPLLPSSTPPSPSSHRHSEFALKCRSEIIVFAIVMLIAVFEAFSFVVSDVGIGICGSFTSALKERLRLS
jgi:hypothetical protein